jgi:hypothetical protein
VLGNKGACDVSEWMSRLRSRMPDELSDVLVRISKQLALTLPVAVHGDCESVIMSVMTLILSVLCSTGCNRYLIARRRSWPRWWQCSWVRSKSSAGSLATHTGLGRGNRTRMGQRLARHPHSLHWRNMGPPALVSNSTLSFCARVP